MSTLSAHTDGPRRTLGRRLKRFARQLDVLRTLYTARTPVYVILYLTSRCNFRCPMCFYLEEIKDPDKEEIAFPELEKLARSLGPLIQLSLTGGEPFLRQDIPEIVGLFVRRNRVRYVTIPTNASLTDRIEETVGRLVRDYPDTSFRIAVSLDGFPQDHDAIRGKGSFEKIERTVAVLGRIRRRVDNLTVDINTCYSALNRGKVAGLVDFVADRFDVDNHTVTFVRGNADESTKDASVEEYEAIVEDIRRRRSPPETRPFSSLLRAVMDVQRDIIGRTLREDRMYVPCVAGKRMIVINEKAEVMPCEILNKKMGNLKAFDYDVPRLLENARARRLVRWIRQSKCHCTFECALATSLIYHKRSYPRVLWRALKHWVHRRPRTSLPTAPDGSLPLPVLPSPSPAGPGSASLSV